MQPQNVFLKFFVAACLFLGISAAQFIIYNVKTVFLGGTKVNQFVDLCTLANVSVLMFDEHIRGYYLHG